MKKEFVLLILALFLLSCGNKSRDKEPVIDEEELFVEQAESDTVATAVQNEKVKSKNEKPSVSASSSYSPRLHESNDNNMRGFDPASEDDMDDNGMSRFMENDDEEGWD